MDIDEAARRAERITHDPLFRDIVEALHAHYAEEWRRAGTVEMRELMWHRDAALTAIQEELRLALERGQVETLKSEQAQHGRRSRLGELSNA